MSESKLTKDISIKLDSDKKGNSVGNATETERDLAQAALTEFTKAEYLTCASVISKLQLSRPRDIKVLSNKAVVEYYISGLTKTETFQKALTDICSQAGIKLDEIKSCDEVDGSVVRLNNCTLLFHLQQLHSAKALLEVMYNGLESLEESVSIGLCLLLAEVLLELSLPGRALAVVADTEATFLPHPLPPQTAATKQLHAEKNTSSPEKPGGKEGPSMQSSMGHAPGSSFTRTNIMNSHSSSDPISGSSEMRCSADQELLRGKLQLLRVRSLLQMRILRVAKKELKALVGHAVSAGNPLNVTLIMLKSELEYLKGSHRKAVKVLNQCSTILPPSPAFSPSLGVSYYNNLGIIHLGLQKPTLACLYFQKSLQELKNNSNKVSDNCSTSSPSSLYSNSNSIGLQLCYNLGVTLMHMNKHSQAFEFLVEGVKAYSSNSRLWLRLAECCIAVHKSNIEKDLCKKFQHKIIGSGLNTKICFIPNISNHDKKLSDQQTTADPALPMPTLEFARMCLRNCLTLIPENVSPAFLTDEQEASGVPPELYPCQPSCPMKGCQVLNVRLRCLACSAYCSLCLADYADALKQAQALLTLIPKVPQVDPILRLLGHLYAGESLVMLGRTSEALPHFDPKQIGDVGPENDSSLPPSGPNESPQAWLSMNSSAMNKLLKYNLGASYALMGQFDKSNFLLTELLKENNENTPAQVIMLALYVNLQLGNTDAISTIIEKGLLTSYI